MSELSNIVATVQTVATDINKVRQAVVSYQQKLAQHIVFIVDQTEGSSQTDIKDCLIAVRGAINSLQKLQESLGQSSSVANDWIAKNSGAGSTSPFSSHSMNFGTGYEEPEEENTHSHRR